MLSISGGNFSEFYPEEIGHVTIMQVQQTFGNLLLNSKSVEELELIKIEGTE